MAQAQQQQRPKALLSGVIYGECAFWIAIAGMIIAIIGILLGFAGLEKVFHGKLVMQHLLSGSDASTIWERASSYDHVQHGHWYLGKLGFSDAISMLGISLCCLAAVVGSWGSVIGMIVNKEKPAFYVGFSLIIAVILTCSAAGLISIH